ncbi:hypothetical protein QC761_200365 [Podospora bellae-mahoneyi]|uniref:Uncharacterized protein n=1 Tax=Podospora bellae-mahoneyi TaxID=2093777 RepID=A0ABR0FQA3_9PEZI|nr:hypothetical protein QC761_200365 [Podospora bellae-mahoneyi]
MLWNGLCPMQGEDLVSVTFKRPFISLFFFCLYQNFSRPCPHTLSGFGRHPRPTIVCPLESASPSDEALSLDKLQHDLIHHTSNSHPFKDQRTSIIISGDCEYEASTEEPPTASRGSQAAECDDARRLAPLSVRAVRSPPLTARKQETCAWSRVRAVRWW